MPETSCPKCNQLKTDQAECSKCGINFKEYESLKHQRLGEVYSLLSESNFSDAKQIAENLPLEFPDNRSDFLLLLSNIKRDISIVEKCDQAKKCCDEGDYSQASFMLRNIKAFDKKLDEKVISLRRKIERITQSEDNFSKAVDAFNSGNYGNAKQLFEKVYDNKFMDDVTEYLHRIEKNKNQLLKEVIIAIRENHLGMASDSIEAFNKTFPGLEEDIEGFTNLVNKSLEIKNMIFDAARKAENENRLLEAKILYLYLGMQFQDTLPQVQTHISTFGKDSVITLADMNEHGIVDLTALGVDVDIDGTVDFTSALAKTSDNSETGLVPDSQEDPFSELAAMLKSQDGIVDTVRKPVDFGGVVISDFIF